LKVTVSPALTVIVLSPVAGLVNAKLATLMTPGAA